MGKEDPRIFPSAFPPTYWIGHQVSGIPLTGLILLSMAVAVVVLFGGVGVGFSEIVFETAFGLRDLAFFPYGTPIWPFATVGIILQSAYIVTRSKVQWTYHRHYGTRYPAFPPDWTIRQKLTSATSLRLALYWFLYCCLAFLDWMPVALFSYLGAYVWIVQTDSTGVLQTVVRFVPTGQVLWALFALLLARCLVVATTRDNYERIWAVSGAT